MKGNKYRIHSDFAEIEIVSKGRLNLAKVDLDVVPLISMYTWWISAQGYVVGYVNKKMIRLHRFITNADPNTDVDHKDLDKLNNLKTNLRICSHSQNCMNRPSWKDKNKPKGVSYIKKSGKYQAYIKVNGKQIHLGYFTDINEAIRIRQLKETELFGEYNLSV